MVRINRKRPDFTAPGPNARPCVGFRPNAFRSEDGKHGSPGHPMVPIGFFQKKPAGHIAPLASRSVRCRSRNDSPCATPCGAGMPSRAYAVILNRDNYSRVLTLHGTVTATVPGGQRAIRKLDPHEKHEPQGSRQVELETDRREIRQVASFRYRFSTIIGNCPISE